MTELHDEIADWSTVLDAILLRCSESVTQYRIVAETSSTQDVARQENMPAGTVIVTGAQTAGRGRYGRTWDGDPHGGVAMSIVLPWIDAPRLAISCAIGVVHGLRAVCSDVIGLGIKWPNDVLARREGGAIPASGHAGLCALGWKKVCGILVEQFGDSAIVGIGINVNQTHWPTELDNRAVSLRQLGCDVARRTVLESVLPAVDAALAMSEDARASAFAEHDVLVGTIVQLRSGDRNLQGRVVRVDPLRGLQICVDDQSETVWCPAETTTLAV